MLLNGDTAIYTANVTAPKVISSITFFQAKKINLQRSQQIFKRFLL